MSAVWALFWNTLDEADPDFSMFLQRPLPSEQNRPQHDEESDVWFYLTRDDIIYEIPRHGRWHPNSTSQKTLRNREFCSSHILLSNCILKHALVSIQEYVQDGPSWRVYTIEMQWRSSRTTCQECLLIMDPCGGENLKEHKLTVLSCTLTKRRR